MKKIMYVVLPLVLATTSYAAPNHFTVHSRHVPTKRTIVNSTNAVAGSILVNVVSQGAKGDGVTDDTTAIQNAINTVSRTGYGGCIYFPPGVYIIKGTLTVARHGITLKGDAARTTTLYFDNGEKDSIYVGAAGGVYNVTFEDMSFDHALTKTGGSAIRLERANQISIHRVVIDNPWNAIETNIVNSVTVSEVIAANIRGPFGVKFAAPANGAERSDVLTLRDSSFNMNNNGGDGILWDGFAHTFRIFGTSVLGARYGLFVRNTAGSGSYYPSFGEFFDLEIDGTNGEAVRIEGGASMAFNGCELFNLATATGPVMTVLGDTSGSYTNSIRISNTRIYGGQKEAIAFAGRDLLISNSQIGAGNSSGCSCIKIDDGVQDFMIIGNQIGSFWGTYVNKYQYAIDIANATYRGLIDNNSFYGNRGNVNNTSTTGTVYVGRYLDTSGIPSFPSDAFITR